MVGDGRDVITNDHMIPEIMDYERMEALTVFTGKGKNAKVLAKDTTHDLALLEIKGKSLPALEIGDESSMREGVSYAFTGFTIGMVLGLHPVTHQGIVSAIIPIVIPSLNSK